MKPIKILPPNKNTLYPKGIFINLVNQDVDIPFWQILNTSSNKNIFFLTKQGIWQKIDNQEMPPVDARFQKLEEAMKFWRKFCDEKNIPYP